MTALVVIGIIIFVLLIIAVLPLGVRAIYDEDGFTAVACIWFVKIKLTGRRKQGKGNKDETEHKKKGGDIRAVKQLLPDVLEALRRLRKKLRVNWLIVRYTAAGDDPARVAVEYGAGQAVMGMIVPAIENTLNVKKRDLSIEADFKGDKSALLIDAKATLLVWQVLYIAAAVIIPLLKKTKKENSEKAV